MSQKLKTGMIGFGSRGTGLLKDVILPMERTEIKMVCDVYEDRTKKAADLIEERTGRRPQEVSDYKKIIQDTEIEMILITCSWEDHIKIAIDAMKAGKAVGMEVAGSYTIEQCWDLVKVYEETKTPIMLLENCCYGRREMMAVNMRDLGVFGTIVHCKGGYHHDLREEVSGGIKNRHYRLRNYLNRNCENYPTHELGPIAKILNLNHGNRMMYLTSVSSKAAGLQEYLELKMPEDPLAKETFAQGDIITTIIKCAGGETITLTLDTTLPRFYSRDFTVRGTKAMYEEATDSVFVDGEEDKKYDFKWKEKWGNAAEYEEKYDHPVWKDYLKEGVKGSHNGMDWLVLKAFFDSVENGTPCPIDVYDTASWMCITALSEESIMFGGRPMAIPDFTKGKWMTR